MTRRAATTSDAYISKYATETVAEYPAPSENRNEPKKWIAQGYQVAITQVYTFGTETGSREHPISLPESYVENAKRVARAQIATGRLSAGGSAERSVEVKRREAK